MEWDNLLIEIHRRSDGHVFKVFENGRIEGFGADCWLINYYPELVLKHALTYHDSQSSGENGINSSPADATSTTSERFGAAHCSPR